MRSALILLLTLLSSPASAQMTPAPSVEAQLCRSQLDLLISGDKLTEDDIARFQNQCDCLDERTETGDKDCAQPREAM